MNLADRKDRLEFTTVIARPQAVAISWGVFGCAAVYQEIATSGFALLAMTW